MATITTGKPPMTRLELLHLIRDNSELLTLPDTFALLSGRLPRSDKVRKAANSLYCELVTYLEGSA
jgi:hypothetical protein